MHRPGTAYTVLHYPGSPATLLTHTRVVVDAGETHRVSGPPGTATGTPDWSVTRGTPVISNQIKLYLYSAFRAKLQYEVLYNTMKIN